MTNVNYKLLSRIRNYRYSNLMAENFLLLPKNFRTTIINISVKAPYQPNLVLFFLGFNVHGYNPIPDIPPREPTIGDALRRRDEGYWW